MISRKLGMIMMGIAAAGCSGGGFTGVEAVREVEVREPGGLEIESVGKGRELQVKVPFDGGIDTCGMQKDSFLMDVGAIRCKNNPAAALAEIFIAALRQAGYKVETGDAPARPTTVHLDGELMLLYSEPVGKAGNEADIHVELTARSLTGLEAHRKFYEKGRGGDAQRSINSAVRRMTQSMVDAVIELMDDYPMLGVPQRSVTAPKPASTGPNR